jgi:hypothetical protein
LKEKIQVRQSKLKTVKASVYSGIHPPTPSLAKRRGEKNVFKSPSLFKRGI